MKHTLLTCAILLPALSLISRADDFTVEEKTFQIDTELQATFLPSQSLAIRIQPDAWTDFSITSLVMQGSVVKKGDVLIGIDSENLDKHIAKVEKQRKSAELTLAQAKHELAQLEINTPRKLEDAARLEKELAENLKWYTEIGHPKDIADAKYSVKKSEQALSYIKEELKQLLIMYKEDDKIEETEEIILTRTQNAVEASEIALKKAKIDSEKALSTVIPRRLLSSQLALKNAQIANASAKAQLPRELELKRLAVAKAERDDEQAKENLAKLKADRAMMNIVAPADGSIYYGSIEQGHWSPEAAAKILKIGGKLPAKTTVMTFIPADSPLQLSAFAGANQLQALHAKPSGTAISESNRYQTIPVKLSQVASRPQTNGKFLVTLEPSLPDGSLAVPGMKATVKLSSSKIDKALKVPCDYISQEADGSFSVQVKLADGKTASRTVSIGASSSSWAVITKGLEKGQVIVKK
ncbi:biotin/lipoyl-binding protein [Verrucomicrobiaceae bacterium N1E253]|uniref:Biotin/lipoyl-binding protein n=1 Tax=Oceaniferula marina TaxID=2748318 RepID=A0A851GJ38_9BACT|nr:biotin/lipoyl-binding protein [Oceaniferula marina]NWK57523.1 biotin/lipoyl-binding protein [Oceaniferula marina]